MRGWQRGYSLERPRKIWPGLTGAMTRALHKRVDVITFDGKNAEACQLSSKGVWTFVGFGAKTACELDQTIGKPVGDIIHKADKPVSLHINVQYNVIQPVSNEQV